MKNRLQDRELPEMLANLKSSADLGVVRKVGWRLPVLQPQSCIVLDKYLHFSELLKKWRYYIGLL